MKGFKVVNGDISITDNNIDMTEGIEFEAQTIETVMLTNKGEDVFDENEGINFRQILGKGITTDMVQTQVKSAFNQVNTDYIIEDFKYEVEKENRVSNVSIKARKSDGSIVSISNSYG